MENLPAIQKNTWRQSSASLCLPDCEQLKWSELSWVEDVKLAFLSISNIVWKIKWRSVFTLEFGNYLGIKLRNFLFKQSKSIRVPRWLSENNCLILSLWNWEMKHESEKYRDIRVSTSAAGFRRITEIRSWRKRRKFFLIRFKRAKKFLPFSSHDRTSVRQHLVRAHVQSTSSDELKKITAGAQKILTLKGI